MQLLMISCFFAWTLTIVQLFIHQYEEYCWKGLNLPAKDYLKVMLRSLSSVYTLVHKVSGDVRALLVDNRLPPLRTVLVGTFADQLEQMGNIATATEEIGRQIKAWE